MPALGTRRVILVSWRITSRLTACNSFRTSWVKMWGFTDWWLIDINVFLPHSPSFIPHGYSSFPFYFFVSLASGSSLHCFHFFVLLSLLLRLNLLRMAFHPIGSNNESGSGGSSSSDHRHDRHEPLPLPFVPCIKQHGDRLGGSCIFAMCLTRRRAKSAMFTLIVP